MQMSDYFESIFHKYMFAYRKFHGWSMVLLTLTEQWNQELDTRHKVIGAVAMDLSKAFDCLYYHMTLFFKSWNFMDLVPNQFLLFAATCHLDINGLNSEIPSRAG